MKSIGKKGLAWLLSLLLAAGCCLAAALSANPVQAAPIVTNGDFRYTVENDQTARIIQYTGSAVELEIPSELDGYAVSSLDSTTFQNCDTLERIRVPDSVLHIGTVVFSQCPNLTEILVSEEHPRFSSQDGILFDKDKTELIRCPEGKTGNYVIPDSVLMVEDHGFDRCAGLTSISIPDSLISMGDYAFANCVGLTQVELPSGITEISWYAFTGCTGLTQVTLPETLQTIGSQAFTGCTGLTGIVIPQSVTAIETAAFSNCTALAEITIPDSITVLGMDPFTNTAYSSQAEHWQGGALYVGPYLACTNGDMEGDYTVRPGTKAIADSAFSFCTQLTGITFPDSLVSIGDQAFYNCTGLTAVEIPEGVARLGDSVFWKCQNLAQISLPDSLTHIGYQVIEDTACYDDPANWQGGVLYLGHHLISAKSTLTGEYTVLPGTKTLASYAFTDCINLTDIQLPDGLVGIGYRAFYLCTGLTGLEIPDSVTNLEGEAFYSCGSMTAVTLPKGLTRLEDGVFSGCTSLTGLTIPDTVTSIGDRAFRYAGSLTDLTLPENLTSIGDSAFYNCSRLTDLVVGEGVTYIGESAFAQCDGLEQITLPDSLIYLGQDAFWNCDSLTRITIPSGVAYLGLHALGYAGASQGDYELVEDFTIYGYSNTAAETYAQRNNIPFVDLALVPAPETLAVASLPGKTAYLTGETFDPTGLTLTLTYSDGSTETVTQGFTFSAVDLTTPGEKQVTVFYAGLETVFSIQVEDSRYDVNGDQTVSVLDVMSLAQQAVGAAASSLDLNGDGVTNVLDVMILAQAAANRAG